MSEPRAGLGVLPFASALAHSARGRIAIATLIAMAVSAALSLADVSEPWPSIPLALATAAVGLPLLWRVLRDAAHRRFGADLLGLLALVSSALLREWWVAVIIALMLSGGEALEEAASARASAVLEALARRSPSLAHRRLSDGSLQEITVAEVEIDDVLVLLPHEICPVDAVVIEGRGAMDESYLTGEPYVVPKVPGSAVLSGAINSTQLLVLRASKRAQDSRYAQIVGVLERAEGQRPPMRRLADRLGAGYTVIALLLAITGWVVSGDPNRFLAVVVIATPCPLLIGVPVAIIGAISLAARNGIIIKDPAMLERLSTARTMIFDKTGTLTYGQPTLAEVTLADGFDRDEVLRLTASLEQYSRHPLASAVMRGLGERAVLPADAVSEEPGQGLRGIVGGRQVTVTGRKAVTSSFPELAAQLPPESAGLECVVLVDDEYAATLSFRDEPREGAREFIAHLGGRHGVVRTMLLSGDRSSEVTYLADRVGLSEAHASVSPERKLEMVREATREAPTVFLGDGINDAPAMTAATVGIAFGKNNDVTAEAADAVVLDSSLDRLDELMHIGRRMRRIALQSAIGGIVVSSIGMVLAVLGILPPIVGAISQEVIDVLAILNASRVAWVRRPMSDFRSE
ncbi:MAG: heavy metal translocating P-type ATPase [Actinomycetes bacterium]